jgi:hypothetical protein
MNCPDCGMQTQIRIKRIKKNAGLTSPASLVEFTAVILFVAAFFQGGNLQGIAILLIAALVLAVLGHRLHYLNVPVAECVGCKKEFVLPPP